MKEIVILFLLLLLGCTEEGSNIETLLVGPPADTTVVEYHYLTDLVEITGYENDTGGIYPNNLLVHENMLFTSDNVRKRVDQFDIETMEHQQRFATGSTLAEDIAVIDDHLVVAAGDARRAEVFSIETGEYKTMLGAGIWYGSVSFAKAVAAGENLVFIRDSKAGIRVFNWDGVDLSAAGNNSYFANLFIDNQNPNVKTDHDMCVIGDSLYAFNYANSTIYSYSLEDVQTEKNNTPMTTYTMPSGKNIYSAHYDSVSNSVLCSMSNNGRGALACYSLESFQNRTWDSPLFSIDSRSDGSSVPFGAIAARHGEYVFFATNNAIQRWTIQKTEMEIIVPKE